MDDIFKQIEKQIRAVCDAFRKEIAGVRANRPNTAIVEDIKVSYYDQPTPIKHLGTVSVVPPREIHIQVWDKSAVQAVAKAVEMASLGFSANVDGSIVRIFLPELSEERREELIKLVKKIAEQHRVHIRQVRDEGNRDIQKMFDDGLCGEDDRFKGRERVQKMVDAANKEIDVDCEAKIKEIKE